MNRKSRMKSTLDSLFSSNKTPVAKPETPPPPPIEKKDDFPVDSTPSEKTPAAKPVENKVPQSRPKASQAVKKPAPAKKPAEKKPSEAPKPVEAVKTVQPAETLPQPVQVEENQVKPPEARPMPAVEQATPAASPPPSVEKEQPVQAVGVEAPAKEAPPEKSRENANSDEEVHLVIFLLAGEAFGIDIQMVESIIKKQAITKVPHAEKFILGVTNLRGTVVPVVDLRQRFAMPVQEATKDTRIIVLNSEGGKNGIVVDEVLEVLRIPKSAIAPTPMIATTVQSSFIKGIARTDEKLIILLDDSTVLSR